MAFITSLVWLPRIHPLHAPTSPISPHCSQPFWPDCWCVEEENRDVYTNYSMAFATHNEPTIQGISFIPPTIFILLKCLLCSQDLYLLWYLYSSQDLYMSRAMLDCNFKFQLYLILLTSSTGNFPFRGCHWVLHICCRAFQAVFGFGYNSSYVEIFGPTYSSMARL